MEQTEKKQLHYKKIENISAYVQKLAKEGANLIIAKKWTRIMARKGTPGEKVISWSVAADGDLRQRRCIRLLWCLRRAAAERSGHKQNGQNK